MKFNSRAIIACLAFAAAAQTVFGAGSPKTISLFNGKDLAGWKTIGRDPNDWTYGKAALNPDDPAKLKVAGPGDELVSTNRTANLSSEATFGDCTVELEF